MLWFSWDYAISADGWGYLTPLFQKKCPLTRLILNRLFNWFWNIFIMTLLSLADFSHSLPVGCCISVHTFSKSPGLGLQLARDLGFLPAQHMLHSYLCELCFHVCSAVHCCILSFMRSQPFWLSVSWGLRKQRHGTKAASFCSEMEQYWDGFEMSRFADAITFEDYW